MDFCNMILWSMKSEFSELFTPLQKIVGAFYVQKKKGD